MVRFYILFLIFGLIFHNGVMGDDDNSSGKEEGGSMGNEGEQGSSDTGPAAGPDGNMGTDTGSGAGPAAGTPEVSPVVTPMVTTTSPPEPAAPRGPIPLRCADYSCNTQPNILASSGGNDDDPMSVGTVLVDSKNQGDPDCKRKLFPKSISCNLVGGGSCYGDACLNAGSTNYCICPFYKIGRQCSIDKTGNCEFASGQLPPGAIRRQNKRWRHKYNAEDGGVYSRHFAVSLNDCIKSCQWSQNACRACNYGQVSGQPVCELLSVAINNATLGREWLKDASGWTFCQVTR